MSRFFLHRCIVASQSIIPRIPPLQDGPSIVDVDRQGDQRGIAQIIRIPTIADVQETTGVPLVRAIEWHDDVALRLVGV